MMQKNKPVLMIFALCLFMGMDSLASDGKREADVADEISKTLIMGKSVWLEATSQKFLALYTETEKAAGKGGVIIVHDSGGHPDQQPLIHQLRTVLPEHGWATLALQMPLREIGADKDEYYPLFPDARARIDAGIQYLKQNGAQTIVLAGYGLGGLMSVSALNQPMPDIKALVTVSLPVSETDVKTAQTLELIKAIKIPMLDIFGALDVPDVVESASERRVAAKENSDYRQIKINDEGPLYLHDEGLLVKRVYSWLARVTENTAAAPPPK